MQRLYGSDDLFPDGLNETCRPHQSINFVTAHDGFCLYDLVAYDRKHNDANGHGNTDGTDDNLSWNCGGEGDANAPPAVLALRRQQAKNFCALLMLANGIPMIVAGDEFLNTQRGNNNPYNQDNEITWLDWARLERNRDIFRFFKLMIAFRKSHACIGRPVFWREDVAWYGPDGPVDLGHESRSVAFLLRGAGVGDGDLYVMINGHWNDRDVHGPRQAAPPVAPRRRHRASEPGRHRRTGARARARGGELPRASAICRGAVPRARRGGAANRLGHERLVGHDLPAAAFAVPEQPEGSPAVDSKREDDGVVVGARGRRRALPPGCTGTAAPRPPGPARGGIPS